MLFRSSSAVFGRVLVVVPGDPERWVQYGVPEAGRPKTQNLSVLAIKKSEDGKNDIYFKDHYRMYEQGEIYLKDRFAVTGQSDNCIINSECTVCCGSFCNAENFYIS